MPARGRGVRHQGAHPRARRSLRGCTQHPSPVPAAPHHSHAASRPGDVIVHGSPALPLSTTEWPQALSPKLSVLRATHAFLDDTPGPGSRVHLLCPRSPEQTSATQGSLGSGRLLPHSALVPAVNPCSSVDVHPKRPDVPHSWGAFSDAPGELVAHSWVAGAGSVGCVPAR